MRNLPSEKGYFHVVPGEYISDSSHFVHIAVNLFRFLRVDDASSLFEGCENKKKRREKTILFLKIAHGSIDEILCHMEPLTIAA